MPLLPTLVGGLTVRERKKRYEDEPRYRRLDFVRSRKSHQDSDEWDVIRTTQPIRAIQLYERPTYTTAWDHQHYGNPQHNQVNYHPQWPRDHPINQIPQPQLSSQPHVVGWKQQRQIEAGPGKFPEVVQLLHGDDSSADDVMAIFETRSPTRKKSRKSHSKSKPRHSGHSIFGDSSNETSDDDDDDDGYAIKRHYHKTSPHNGRGRSRSKYRYEVEDERPRRSVTKGR